MNTAATVTITPVRVHSGPPHHLVVLYDVGACGASYHPESAAFAVLACPIMTDNLRRRRRSPGRQ